MAGYDAHFRFSRRDEQLVVTMFDLARRRAPSFDVRWQSQIDRSRWIAWCAMDGNGFMLDVLLERLRRDWPIAAEVTQTSRRPQDRRHVGAGLAEIVTRYRRMLYDRYPAEWLPLLRARSDPLVTPVYELWTDDPQLQHRLDVTMDVLASWLLDEVAPEVVIEELHTAAELMLESAINQRSRRLSFRELVDSAASQDLLRASDVDALISLKDVRKRVRHRASGESREWLDTNFWHAAIVLEQVSGAAWPDQWG